MKIFSVIMTLIIFWYINGDYKALANDVEIVTIPEGEFLFEISNMKPGDWGQRNLVVQNGGTEDFNYSIIVNNKSSNNKLFNELKLEIYEKDKTNLLFENKLNNFNGFTPKLLKKGESDDLLFLIKMPFELGNEFQETSALFEIKIVAESSQTPTTPQVDSENNENPTLPVVSQGPSLPNTGTNIYNILLLGAILITTGLTFIFLNKRITKKKE